MDSVRGAAAALVAVIVAFAGCSKAAEAPGEARKAGGEEMARKPPFEEDVFQTDGGELKIAFIGHATLMFTFGGKVIHVDPVSGEADYAAMPKGDLVLITHEHADHLDPAAIAAIRKEGTVLVLTEKCAAALAGDRPRDQVAALKDAVVMKNGDAQTAMGLKIEGVPAYNILHKRPSGDPFHPKGVGNGYVIAFGDKRLYVAGDTENTPEMKALKDIAIAFLPMNLPYTMTPEMVADAAKAFRPKVLYPYHYGQTDPAELVRLLADEKDIEVRIRRMK